MGTNHQTLQKGYVLQGKKNRYIIDCVLGQGAFGITYLARYKASIQGDIGSGSVWAQVAIKEFFMRDLNVRDCSTGYLNDSSQDSLIGRYRRAFMREARNLAGLHHDNIVNVFEVIETNNTVYIVMEYINGGTLDEHIAQSGKLSEQESVDSILKLCSAVNCMHEHRMLHLDIKPKNVMLDEDGQLYLIDFGLSKQYTADGEPESSTSIGLGTPGYAPVEQAEHQDGDKKFRATIDVYALGATLFKMLTGSTPPKASQVSDSVIDDDNIIPKLLKESGISDNLISVVAKAMWPSSRRRYQTVKELVDAIEEANTSSLVITVEDEETILAPLIPSSESIPEPASEPISMPIPKPDPEPLPEPEPEPDPEPTPTQNDEPKPDSKEEPAPVSQIEQESESKDSKSVPIVPLESCATKYTSLVSNIPRWKLKLLVFIVIIDAILLIVPKSQIVTWVEHSQKLPCASNVSYRPNNSGKHKGHKFVDLGLSVKWATCNIGANSPEEYGNYYAWGETETKTNYDWSTYKFYDNETGEINKYDSYPYYRGFGVGYAEEGGIILEPEDDAAHINWGGNWRMPTDDEFSELMRNCIFEAASYNHIQGYVVTSKIDGYTDNSIFLPAAGYHDESGINAGGAILLSSSNGAKLEYASGGLERRYGYTVRPVLPKY